MAIINVLAKHHVKQIDAFARRLMYYAAQNAMKKLLVLINIKCVDHVINYDMPDNIEEYVQRIGRTGRLGNPGMATSFFDNRLDEHLIEPIIKILSSANQEIPYWLLKRAQKINNAEEFDQFGGTDIRLKSNIDEVETW